MPTTNAIYQRRSDNVARNATITIQTGTPAADSKYGPSALVDDVPALVAKIDSTTAAWLIDFGATQRVDLVALIHHTFDAGADVKIQANTSNSWGSPAFSASFTVPSWQGAGETLWPVNPWLDLTQQAGYSATGWRYWRLVVTGNSQNVQLGQLWMSPTIRSFTINFDDGASRTRTRPVAANRTRVGVDAIYPVHSPRYSLQFQISYLLEPLRADLDAQWDDVGGRWSPWLWIEDGSANDARLVRWLSTDEQRKRALYTYDTFTTAVEEVSRGLRPGV